MRKIWPVYVHTNLTQLPILEIGIDILYYWWRIPIKYRMQSLYDYLMIYIFHLHQ